MKKHIGIIFLFMTYQLNGQQLQKALEMLAEVVSPLKKEETVLERPSDGDLLYYDNASMMEKLKVSERTLQRYRKNGKIRHTTFGGKIYYPKNFMVLPVPEPEVPEGEKNNIVPLNEFTKRYNTPRPRSKIIDVDRLAKRLTYFPRSENKDFKKFMKHLKVKRKKNHASLNLWPKKIKLIGLPIVTRKTIPPKE